jgi:hypothetical protein
MLMAGDPGPYGSEPTLARAYMEVLASDVTV